MVNDPGAATSSPASPRGPWWRTPVGRVVAGLLGLAAVAGAWVPTSVWLLGLLWQDGACVELTPAWREVAGSALFVAWAAAVGICWAVVLSAFRVAAGRAVLRRRTWIWLPAVLTAGTLVFVVIESATTTSPPPGAPVCGGVDWSRTEPGLSRERPS